MKVDFMIIGAMKGGTTSLSHHFMRHPEVCFCSQDDPNFFSKSHDWKSELPKYHKLYKSPQPGQKLGEVSASYTMRHSFEETCDRIYEYNPSMKLLYIMRDPIERIVSHYSHRYVRKRIHKAPYEEVRDDHSYVDCSRYFYQITPYMEKFGPENILMFTLESFAKAPQETLKQAARLIGISESGFEDVDTVEWKNKTTDRFILPDYHNPFFYTIKRLGHRYLPDSAKNFAVKMVGNKMEDKIEFPVELRHELYDRVEKDVREIEGLMGRQLTEWKQY